MKRIFILFFIAFAFCACGNDEALRVGMAPNYYPFNFKDDDGKLSGFDVELVNELSKRLNLDVVYKSDLKFDDLSLALLNSEIDMIASSFSITADRLLFVDFTKPYYFTKSVYVKRGNDIRIRSKEDLRNKKIGVRKGSLQEKSIKEQSIARIKIVSIEEIDKLFRLLNSKEIDALFIDDSIADAYLGLYKDLEKFHYEEDGSLGYAFAFKKNENEGLIDSINEELENMKKDGIMKALLDKFNLP
ncbi:ABC transporter substrate-binding protein [uncultured Campylobacter sp.]|uniref:substrate-binding periplasmic protein n=1 Tax=uncultured Campylobacter sp. TaxID=218934 RepID=UPI0026235600|nr:ABC transporter substrate-binding protein [uncultured Campylobacter sp.]